MEARTFCVSALISAVYFITDSAAQCCLPTFPRESPLYPYVSPCGPAATIEPIRALNPLVLPPTSGPLYVLPCPPPPPPTVVGTKCYCTKTVVKPRLYQRLIRVQKNQRFLKRTYTPVVERIPFIAKPRCPQTVQPRCGNAGAAVCN